MIGKIISEGVYLIQKYLVLLLVVHLLMGCTVPDDQRLSRMLIKVTPAIVTLESDGGTTGTGFLVKDNLVITNAHLVKEPMLVILNDGDRKPWKNIIQDKELDVAIGYVQTNGKQHLRLREQSPQLGETVYAVGNPFGLGVTVTQGIVSAEPRAIQKSHLLQTDAAINPGNSGGPLIDSKGRVVGLVSARAAIGYGIGFAVPVKSLQDLLQRIPKNGN